MDGGRKSRKNELGQRGHAAEVGHFVERGICENGAMQALRRGRGTRKKNIGKGEEKKKGVFAATPAERRNKLEERRPSTKRRGTKGRRK